ncbi:DUF2213 domain-containing protein [Salmonella enterica]|nr:DUF2213 domain-containing protein [Salmonella enterica]EAQ5917891.1 DUF2213 domain-containing protein [Salmonella enterica subsp. enterica serovar Inverness]EAQ5751447.1 DUF2213 domain-containing protein [Salmonella enterica]EAW7790221.1 DUF2213 domain-containing protein [Salmonella enterica]EAW7850160.1 DUF2213 domain-containing protein [Salmonella enterica]
MPVRKVDGGWQWGNHGKVYPTKEEAEEQEQAAYANGYTGDSALAFDRATVRSFDKDGRLHIELTPISKANVCPYYGREIPNSRSLGLQPDKVYYLLRDPKELAKAASTFNNIPLLNEHIPVTAADPQKMAVVGSTGTDSEFDGTYLKNSLVVWDADSIAGIETDEKKELSSAYRYVADMTPGVHEGQPYDGVMRDIVGNHVALVIEGRAGSDVVVGDSIPTGMKSMSELTKKLMAIITPMLASDEKPEDVEKKVQKVVEDEATQAEKDNESEAERLKREEKELKDREERERKYRDRDRKEAEDGDDDGKEKKKAEDEDDEKEDKAAMDSALIRKAEENVMGRIRQANEARECVRPLVGDVSLVAMDSAEDIYRFALDSIGANHKGVHPSALKSMVEFSISQKSDARKPNHGLGMDSAATTSFAKAFPGATKMKRS